MMKMLMKKKKKKKRRMNKRNHLLVTSQLPVRSLHARVKPRAEPSQMEMVLSALHGIMAFFLL